MQTVDAYSHPISCGDGDFQLDKQNELDGEVHYLMSRVRNDGDSSETETDSETEMTVIKPKLSHKMRLGSNQSYGKLDISHSHTKIAVTARDSPNLNQSKPDLSN